MGHLKEVDAGTTQAPRDHNHAHTPLQIIGMKDGKPAVIATE